MNEMTPAAELRFMLLFLCMESLGSKFEGGLGAYFEEEELEDIHQLYWHLRDNVIKDMIRGGATGHRLAKERIAEEKNKKEA